MKMSHHPINYQANENSPYGDLTREEFYKQHQIFHRESFMLNRENMKVFTQTWLPADYSSSRNDHQQQLKGLVAMVHGYTSDSSWLSELTAVAMAKLGFLVCALDLQGHGQSDGFPGHIPNIQHIVNDCIQFFDSVKSQNPNLPSFLYGESLGGAISILISLQQKYEWDGLVLNGSMCGISAKFKPIWPLEKLLPVAALLAPTWKLVVTKPLASKSYKEEWKRRLVAKNPNRRTSGKPPAATALEFLRVCKYIRLQCNELEVPLLILHGGDDVVCDVEAARFVYESAASKEKTLKIFPGMRHMLIGESKENVEVVFGNVFSWIEERATKTKLSNKN
ncbi:caffeoylshikimate esterase-like [Melia azedarach]|uniref:Caffeoylshikimate esterase-like n=1 Tax=Melia azedarach TaxID=155640 RepID=A0ACC1WUX8_MELAZ|nr:caffeoylshikimate esterase-like [Melia azedarach]